MDTLVVESITPRALPDVATATGGPSDRSLGVPLGGAVGAAERAGDSRQGHACLRW